MSTQRVYINGSEFQPKNNYVLVNPVELKSEEVTETGLVLGINENKSVINRPTMGDVIAIGKDIEDIAEGETVFWPNTDGIDFEFNDGIKVLLKYESIIGSKK